MKVVVLGAGIIGTTTAYYLAKLGYQVTVVEARPGPGEETSFANGALLAAGQTEPWNTPGIGWKIAKWIGKEDSPMLLRPTKLPQYVGWGLEFLKHSRPEPHERGRRGNVALGMETVRELRRIRDEEGIDYDHTSRGILRVFRDADGIEARKKMNADVADLGVTCQALDPAEAVDYEPALGSLKDEIAGALLYDEDESGDCHKFCVGLTQVCRELGVAFQFDTRITGIDAKGEKIAGVETDKGRFEGDLYVLALGLGSVALARTLGIKLPIMPVKGYSVTLARDRSNTPLSTPVIDADLLTCTVPLQGRIRMAGTAEFAGEDRKMDETRAGNVLNRGLGAFPEMRRSMQQDDVTYWTGLRPVTPDGRPIVGDSPYANLYLNTGHGPSGWTLSCATSKAVAALIDGRRPEVEVGELHHTRFH